MIDFRFHVLALVIALPGWIACARAEENYYDTQHARAVKACQAIDPADYQSGLAFNPDGYRSFYKRSECLQEAAAKFRDESLCKDVKERWALLWSSWAISEKRCRELVTQGIEKDRAEIEKIRRAYDAGPVRLADFRVQKNGNGRDYDIFPSLEPGYQYSYDMRFEIVSPSAPGGAVLLVAHHGALAGNDRLGLYVPVAGLRQRFAAFTPGGAYRVRATLVLDVPYGGASHMWSDAFIEKYFPRARRTQTMEKEASF